MIPLNLLKFFNSTYFIGITSVLNGNKKVDVISEHSQGLLRVDRTDSHLITDIKHIRPGGTLIEDPVGTVIATVSVLLTRVAS